MQGSSRAFGRGRSCYGLFAAALLTATLASGCGGGGGSSVDISDKPSTNNPITGAGAIWLSWRAPTERANGSALGFAELEGYRVYWGPVGNPIQNSIEVGDATVTAYQIQGVAAGTYEVAVTAIDTDGLESALSETMTTAIN